MIDLSVIIVSYNVKYFLRQCLQSVARAMEGLAVEVWVVDNASIDGSVEMVREEFPWAKLIANSTNLGFAKANNQAIQLAKGRHILLLNPDTIVQEDTFRVVVEFLDAHPEAGAVGVKIIDGQGRFSPDSRRDLPSAWNIFCKLSGLYRLFPKSRLFGRYHLTFLPENEVSPVPVLLGAFMALPRRVLNEVGLLDERFFMYAEDIDLCYRILQAGYKNYYLPTTQIVHFKGESTKSRSLNYVLTFYKASLQFVQKHYRGWRRLPIAFLYQIGIVSAALFSAFKRILNKIYLPVLEVGALYGVGLSLFHFWKGYTGKSFYPSYEVWGLLGYAIAFMLGHAVFLNYTPPYRIRRIAAAVFIGFLMIVLVSYLIPSINVSRFMVLALAGAAVPLGLALRALDNWLRRGRLHLTGNLSHRVLVVAEPSQFARIRRLLFEEIQYPAEFIGFVSPRSHPQALGLPTQLPYLLDRHNPDELIFCNTSLSSQEIISLMMRYFYRKLSFKIIPPYADYLIGPQSILVSRHSLRLYLRLHQPEVLFQKKIFDLGVSLMLLMAYPFTFWIYHEPLAALKSLFGVLLGRYHFVSYSEIPSEEMPLLKEGLLTTDFLRKHYPHTFSLDLMYAHRYSVLLDWKILLTGLPHLGTLRSA
ncbi:MAG: glycosyltransferase [Bacteroidia bacterium]|nr:glycosyltransferase family 2 protein [Bacteroidia bacterium]MDW8015469.1 glycosyltransferase [Bacteroidia bacterium]